MSPEPKSWATFSSSGTNQILIPLNVLGKYCIIDNESGVCNIINKSQAKQMYKYIF